ncbi:DUF2922 domain-containing protein [Desulfolucanica intricata]|uniref:DUF2922 domain-containing protein n=1 Tax=Desulfolucanica intricata TaxID=1285191 RepID=UPI00083354BC|nr:DUF2922 domain-containing protein [Desulfolucanica intricata]
MAVTQTLRMVFLNQAGSRVTVSVENPRDDIAQAEVQAAMDTIIAKNILTTSGGDLVSVDSARIVDVTTTDIISNA